MPTYRPTRPIAAALLLAVALVAACREPSGLLSPIDRFSATSADSIRGAIHELVSREMSPSDSAVLTRLRTELSASIASQSTVRHDVAFDPALTVPSVPAGATASTSCTVTSDGPVAPCTVQVSITPQSPVPLLQSSYPTRVQQENVHGRFTKDVVNVGVSGMGAISCNGTFGRLIGYDSTDTEVAHVDLQLIDPSDCGADAITFGAAGTLVATKGIRSFTIEPPQPWAFPVGSGTGHVTAFYTLTYSPPEHVAITYAPRTPIVAEGTGWAPIILPGGISSAAVTGNAGKPPTLYGADLWPDSLIMDIGVDSLGTRVANRAVTVSIRAVDERGHDIDGEYGHLHGGAAGVVKSAGALNRTSVVTDAGGHTKVILRPSTISGPVIIVAKSPGADSVVDTIRVAVPGLVALTAGTTHDLVGETDIHPSSHWVRQEMATLLVQFADSMHVLSDSVTHYNDASIRYGGKFDLNRQWSSPDAGCVFRKVGQPPKVSPNGCHSRHRIGLDNDVRSSGFARNKGHMQDVMDLWEELSGTRPVHEADHLHFAYRPN